MSVAPVSELDETQIIDGLIARARDAQAKFENGATQERYDNAALAAAWALMHLPTPSSDGWGKPPGS